MANEQKVVTRRTVAKGAAWSVPVIALGAGAAQAAASGPTCPPTSCAAALANAVTMSSAFDYGSNTGDLTIAAGALIANFLTTGCGEDGLLQASLFTINSATLTMTNNTTTYTAESAGLPVGVSVASVSTLLDIGATFKGVAFPDGGLLSGLLNPPTQPASICIDYSLVLNIIGSGTPPQQTQPCPGQVCFKFNLLTGTLYSVNQVGNAISGTNGVTYVSTGLAL